MSAAANTFAMVLLLLPLAARADYDTGLDAYRRGDYGTAMAEWRAAADAPGGEAPTVHAETLYAIAMLYWQGQGVAQDFGQARAWLLRAARMNHAAAQAKLGYLYATGTSVPRDLEQAFNWYREAARLGDVDGQYNLGVFYLNGWGTEPDRTMAAQYLAAASAQGDAQAEQDLQSLLAAMPEPAPQGGSEAGSGAETEVASLLLDSDWILAQPPEQYTLQVIALSDRGRVENLVAGFDELAPFALYTVQRQGHRLYVLVQGAYADVDAARRARDHFPAAVQRADRLWIRQFGMVQDQVRRQAPVTAGGAG